MKNLVQLFVFAFFFVIHAHTMAQEVYEPSGRFNIAGNGQYVDDWNTGIRWKRCVEGMTWDSGRRTCVGQPREFNYDEVNRLLNSNPSWGIADPAEYRSLVECGSTQPSYLLYPEELRGYAYTFYKCESTSKKPTINQDFFPNTPSDREWAMPKMTTKPFAQPHWSVDFGIGRLSLTAPIAKHHVRLMNYTAKDISQQYFNRLKEDQLFEMATDREGMETYLSVMPNGKRASEVEQKLETYMYDQANDLEGMKNYLERFPEGRHSQEISSKIESLLASGATNVQGMEKYLSELPEGDRAAEVEKQLEQVMFSSATNMSGIKSYLSRFPNSERATIVRDRLVAIKVAESKDELIERGFEAVGDGSAVYHLSTGLTWARCASGQEWNAVQQTCQGTPTFIAAKQSPNALNLEGEWRLPFDGELRSIREKGDKILLDSVVFPNSDKIPQKDIQYKYFYYSNKGQVVSFSDYRADQDQLTQNRVSGGYIRPVRGQFADAELLCLSVYIFKAEEDFYQKSPSLGGRQYHQLVGTNSLTPTRDFYQSLVNDAYVDGRKPQPGQDVPRGSFESYWREQADKNDSMSATELMNECKRSYGVEANNG
ncbi:DUF1566 domain-containing protein [Marinobacter flavimaris]|nr:DUF1566 domain-containing protein [Marinobacter flavimaris]